MKPKRLEDWVRLAQQGNIAAFNYLAESFRSIAFQEAYRRLGDKHLAEDATQDAFLEAYKHLKQLRQPKSFVAWVRQIVRSQCNLRTRRKDYDMESIEDSNQIVAKTPTPENIVQRREQEDALHEALDSLPEHERIVTEEYYLKGKKQSDIAEEMGIPVATVKKRLQYARKKLKGMIDKVNIHPLQATGVVHDRTHKIMSLPNSITERDWYLIKKEPHPTWRRLAWA